MDKSGVRLEEARCRLLQQLKSYVGVDRSFVASIVHVMVPHDFRPDLEMI